MQTVADRPEAPTAIRTDLGAIFVSLELSRSTWLITSLSPGGGEKMSKQVVRGGDVAGLLERFARLREKARARTGKVFPFVVIQEAGLDGFWIDRALQNEGIESHVVDPASIATSRRRRRAKTDGIDGEALVRALLAYKRGEPRVCAMVKAPTPEEEDRRRLCRERKVLIGERVQHVNRVKGLLFSQGISGYEPLRRDRRERLDTLQTGDGRLLPDHLKAQVCRELDRLELLLEQIKAVEAERDVLLAAQQVAAPAPAAMLLDIKGIGPEFAASDESLCYAVALGLAYEGGRCFDPQAFHFVLEIAGHVVGAMIVTQLQSTRHTGSDGSEAPMHPLTHRLQGLEAIGRPRCMNADDFRVGVFHGDEDIGPAFPDGDRLRHVRSPHFIDLIGDDRPIVRLGLGASNAMRREQAVLTHHPSHTAGARANASKAQSRP